MKQIITVVIVSVVGILLIPQFAYRVECHFMKSCYQNGNTVFISEDPQKIRIGMKAQPQAQRRFEKMFEFQTHFGVLVLDQGLATPLSLRLKSRWELRFDPVVGVGADPVALAMPKVGQAQTHVPTISDIEQDVYEVAVISHEICHVLFATWAGKNYSSDVMNELAAISCEPPILVQSRIKRFADLYNHEQALPWDRFVMMQHSVAERAALAEALSRESAKKGGVLQFTVDAQTDLGREIDLFYAQSAAFVEFWRTRCPKERILSQIFAHLQKQRPFSRWFDSNPPPCSPASFAEFERDFAVWIRQRSAS